MTGDNMKSDLIGASRIKVDGRQSIHRRRMSKNSSFYENGDHLEQDLTLAIEESLRCAKQPEICTSDDSKTEDSEHIMSIGNQSSGKFDQSLENEPDEVKKLRELLLLHLDLIHQQNELLTMKDQQLKTVKAEREALKCRLERMERRMSLLKQKDDQDAVAELQHTTIVPSSGKQEQHIRAIKQEPHTNHNRGLRQAEQHGRGIKRKLDCHHRNSHHKNAENASKRCRLSRTRTLQNQRHQKRRSKMHSQESDSEEIDSNKQIVEKLYKLVGNNGKKVTDNGVLRSEFMYYVPPSFDMEEELPISPVKPNTDAQNVEVPTFRLNPVSRYYNLEGTENLEDEVFIKRHQKPELEEKRRKRWDIQRLREQHLVEKLQGGRSGNKNKQQTASQQQNTTVSTFCPNLSQVQYIEVCEKIPVCAFGFPIPDLKPTEFELPWYDIEKRDRVERGRGGRKKRS